VLVLFDVVPSPQKGYPSGLGSCCSGLCLHAGWVVHARWAMGTKWVWDEGLLAVLGHQVGAQWAPIGGSRVHSGGCGHMWVCGMRGVRG